MPKVRASSATMGTTCAPMRASRSSCVSCVTNTIVVDCSRSAMRSIRRAVSAASGAGKRGALGDARRHVAAQALALLRAGSASRGSSSVGAVEAQSCVRRLPTSAARSGRGMRAERRLRASSAGASPSCPGPTAHAVALLGLRQDHRRPAAVRGRCVIGGVDLHRVVAAALQAVDVVVGHVGRQSLQLGVLVEEVLAVEAAVGRGVLLQLAIDGFVQAPQEHAFVVAREQRVPVASPTSA